MSQQPKSRVRSASGRRGGSRGPSASKANASGAQGGRIYTNSAVRPTRGESADAFRGDQAKPASALKKVQFQESTVKPRNVGFNQVVSAKGITSKDPSLHNKTTSLTAEYMQRKKVVNSEVQKVIEANKMIKLEMNQKTIAEMQAKAREKEEFKKNNPMMAELIEDVKLDDDGKIENGLVQLVRSKRNLAMRVKDNLDLEVDGLEQEKIELIQKLNDALIRLGKLNSTKRDLSNALVEKIKFVRDLQKATHGGDDLECYVSQQMKDEFKREQQMNMQLREELKRCEMERLRVLERIKLLSGEKEVVVVRTNGMKKTYKVTTINIERMLDDINRYRDEVHCNEPIVERTRNIVLQTEEELGGVERQVGTLRVERDLLQEKTIELSGKYDDAVVALEGEKQRMSSMHRMHVKLLSTRQFEETMQRIILRNKELGFEQIIRVTSGDQRQFGAVWKFKQVLLMHEQKRKKRALQKWYLVACDPMARIRLNDKIPLFYTRNRVFNLFFNKWRYQYLANRQAKIERKQKLVRCFTSLDSYWKRRMKVQYLCWRDQLIIKNEAIRTLYKFVSNQRIIKTQQAFQRWKNAKIDFEFNMRMHSLCVKMSIKRLKSHLFFAWRIWARRQKIMKHNLKLRTFKNLRINVVRRKQLALMTLGTLGVQHRTTDCLKQLVWNALRQNKEECKLAEKEGQLQNDELPQILQLTKAINRVSSKSSFSNKVRALKAVMHLAGRNLGVYFNRWKKTARRDTFRAKVDFKRQILRLYKNKLREAFYLWRTGRNKCVLYAQQGQIDMYQDGNQDLDVMIRKTKVKIRETDESTKSVSSKHLRKLWNQAGIRNVQYWLRRWAQNSREVKAKQNGAALILKKVRRRLIRIAFDRYRRKVGETRQDKYNEARIVDVKRRLAFRTKKRIYNAIKSFAGNHHNATNFLRALLRSLEKRNKAAALSKWAKFRHAKIDEKLKNEQNQLVEELGELQQAHGALSDQVNEMQIGNKRLSHALRVEAKKTLQKWFERSHMGSMRYGFSLWRRNGIRLRFRNLLIQNAYRHQEKNAYKMAFSRWKETIHKENSTQIVEMMTDSDHGIGLADHSLNMAKKARVKTAVENSRHQEKVKSEIKVIGGRIAGVIGLLIKKKDENHHVTNMRHIVQVWHSYAKRKKACCKILEKAITNTLLQTTFTKIRDFQRSEELFEAKQGRSNQLAVIIERYRLRRAISLWRTHLFQKHKKAISHEVREMQGDNFEHNLRVKKIKHHQDDLGYRARNRHILVSWFENWRKYSYEERDTRLRTEKLREALHLYKKRRAVLKWNQRSRQTKKLRCFLARCTLNTKGLELKMIFKAWKNEYLIDRYMATRCSKLVGNLQFVAQKLSFQRIKHFAAIKDESNQRAKEQAQKIMATAFTYYTDHRKRHYFNKLKLIAFKDSKNHSKLKRIVFHLINNRLRSMFFMWKHRAKENEVVNMNEEEDGPVNVRLWNIKVDEHNLEQLMIKDGATPDEILALKQGTKDKFKYLTEKSLCRLLVKQSDLSLLPTYLDQWRKYVKMRKLWRRTVESSERRLQRNQYLANTQWAFEKMKYKHSDRVVELKRIPFQELKFMAVDNNDKLQSLLKKLDGNHEGIEEYTDQRNVLLRGYIAGQKLALSACNNNQKRAMFKTFSKLVDHGNKTLQANIEQALQSNLDKIAEMKDRIAKHESENEQLAVQNDVFRKGAMDGISMARHVEELTGDREKLSVDLADKSVTIRKLLEDNEYLNSKLENAESLLGKHNAKMHHRVQQVKHRNKLQQHTLDRNESEEHELQIEKERLHTESLIEQAERENQSSRANQSHLNYMPHDSASFARDDDGYEYGSQPNHSRRNQ